MSFSELEQLVTLTQGVLDGIDPAVFLSWFSSPLYSLFVTGASRMNFPMDPMVVQDFWRSGSRCVLSDLGSFNEQC